MIPWVRAETQARYDASDGNFRTRRRLGQTVRIWAT